MTLNILNFMKQVLALLSLLVLVACSNNDTINNCNYLLNLGVNATVNLNLPQYSQLQFTGSSVYIANQGNGGIIVINAGSSLRAWDASDPNHPPSTCSVMQIVGANAKCSCADENEYSLFIGSSVGASLPCALKEYRVTPLGNNSYSITN
ncbi:hypothetical protein OE09_0250 [Flavobacteriaceae bacterium MAR_2010_72]|nr:hypothetical protein OE09_0250 [Flavobacteriaceae bacterium MAR_2010_72]TVZ58049.1 hypothetical protein NA63_0542 [Flavobacteriaceae bacterium MAR_2010_105]